MDDALLVRGFERGGDLARVGDGGVDWQRDRARSSPSTSSMTMAPCSMP